MKEFKFPSSSGPGEYTTVINDDGHLSCNCRGWIVKKEGKPRECKHTKKVAEDEGLALVERDGMWYVSGAAGSPYAVTAPPTFIKRQEAASEVKAPGEFVSPMLASAMPEGKNADSFNSDWIMEEKFDGHRLVIRVGEEYGNPDFNVTTVRAWSRLGNNRSLPYHIHEAMLAMPVGVYDGELIVPESQHSYRVTAGQSTGKEALVLFDMLETQGKSLMKNEQHVRRAFLDLAYSTFDGSPDIIPISVAAQLKPSMAEVQAIWDRGGEGAILKKLSAKYTPGWRSPDWIKVKAQLSAVLTIIGFEQGKNGPYSTVKLRDAQGVETTVKTVDNRAMREFEKSPNSYIGKRLVISYQEKMPSGKYRHPMFDHLAGVGE